MYSDARGRKCLFSLHTKLALMFLKSYTGFNDRKLVEYIKTNGLDRIAKGFGSISEDHFSQCTYSYRVRGSFKPF